MSNVLIWILLLCIWNSILFFGKKLGLSVLLFTIPFLVFTLYILIANKKVKNKSGLLFIIPIILLSATYLIFDNLFFKIINIPILCFLFILMYIYTIKPTYNIGNIITDLFTIIFEPLNYISKVTDLISKKCKKVISFSPKAANRIKSFIIILPIIFIVLILLSSADMVFENIFTSFFNIFENISLPETIENLSYRIIFILIMFFYLSLSTYFIINHYSDTKNIPSKIKKSKDNYTMKLLLTILNIIYIIFDIIQIKSLILHQVSMDITYAEYARQGFFQLMFVSIINITIILISKLFEDQENKTKNKYNNIMSILMIFLTFIIIISSFIRMYMYESEYGYTLLRLLVYFALITESLMLIPTIFYIFNSRIKIIKFYLVIGIITYTVLNYTNVDYLIAYRNINRYYETGKIDLEYLTNNNTDNINLLIDLYNNTEDNTIKNNLEIYFINLNISMDGFQEFNMVKNNAKGLLKDIKCNLENSKNLYNKK